MFDQYLDGGLPPRQCLLSDAQDSGVRQLLTLD